MCSLMSKHELRLLNCHIKRLAYTIATKQISVEVASEIDGSDVENFLIIVDADNELCILLLEDPSNQLGVASLQDD